MSERERLPDTVQADSCDGQDAPQAAQSGPECNAGQLKTGAAGNQDSEYEDVKTMPEGPLQDESGGGGEQIPGPQVESADGCGAEDLHSKEPDEGGKFVRTQAGRVTPDPQPAEEESGSQFQYGEKAHPETVPPPQAPEKGNENKYMNAEPIQSQPVETPAPQAQAQPMETPAPQMPEQGHSCEQAGQIQAQPAMAPDPRMPDQGSVNAYMAGGQVPIQPAPQMPEYGNEFTYMHSAPPPEAPQKHIQGYEYAHLLTGQAPPPFPRPMTPPPANAYMYEGMPPVEPEVHDCSGKEEEEGGHGWENKAAGLKGGCGCGCGGHEVPSPQAAPQMNAPQGAPGMSPPGSQPGGVFPGVAPGQPGMSVPTGMPGMAGPNPPYAQPDPYAAFSGPASGAPYAQPGYAPQPGQYVNPGSQPGQMSPEQAAYLHHLQKDPSQLLHDRNRHGELMEVIGGIAAGQPDVPKIVSLLESCDPQFWKGALIGAAASFVMTSDPVKNLLAGAMGATAGMFGQKAADSSGAPKADAPEEAAAEAADAK